MFYSLLVYYRRDTDKVLIISILMGDKGEEKKSKEWKIIIFKFSWLYHFMGDIKKNVLNRFFVISAIPSLECLIALPFAPLVFQILLRAIF